MEGPPYPAARNSHDGDFGHAIVEGARARGFEIDNGKGEIGEGDARRGQTVSPGGTSGPGQRPRVFRLRPAGGHDNANHSLFLPDWALSSSAAHLRLFREARVPKPTSWRLAGRGGNMSGARVELVSETRDYGATANAAPGATLSIIAAISVSPLMMRS